MSLDFIKKLFKKNDPIIKFKAVHGAWSVATPVLPALKFKAKWQVKQSKENSIVHCPGVHDYMSSGYIISAHCDIRIKATKAGTRILLNAGAISINDNPLLLPNDRLDPKLISGVFDPNNVKLEVCKIPLPWSVVTSPGYSVYCLPCTLQADYLDKLMVWPGVIDCDNYHFLSLIFSAKEECEIFLPTGTPLLHVIPFKREHFTGECGKANEQEEDIYKYHIISKVAQTYRRFFHTRKKFSMKGSQDHRYM